MWRCLFQDQKKWLWWNLPKKTTWMSVRTLLGNSIGQIRSIWKLNYDILNVFMAVLVKHFIDNLKKSLPLSTYYIYITCYIWHEFLQKDIPFPTSPSLILIISRCFSRFPPRFRTKEHSCQVELPHTCLQGGWNQHWNPEVLVDKLSGRAEVWWYTPEIQYGCFQK